jgi:hypothetical protein
MTPAKVPIGTMFERWRWRHTAEGMGFTEQEAARLAFTRWRVREQGRQSPQRRTNGTPASPERRHATR